MEQQLQVLSAAGLAPAALAAPALPDLNQLLLHQQMLQAQQQQLLQQGLHTAAMEIQKQIEQLQAIQAQLSPIGTDPVTALPTLGFHNFQQFTQQLQAQTQQAAAAVQQQQQAAVLGAAAADNSALAERVKAIQRSSAEGKQAWVAYCEQQGTGYFDPSRHDAAFLQGFLDSLGVGAQLSEDALKAKGEKGKGKGKGKPKGMGPPEPLDGPDVEQHKVFVASLPRTCTEEQLLAHFSQYGEVQEVRLKYDPNDGSFRGFAFVTFNEKEVARKILENYDNNYYEGKWVACVPVKMRPGKGGGPSGKVLHDTEGLSLDKIFVSGLPAHTTEENLKAFFEGFGPVQSLRLMYNQSDGSFRGFAFVTFEDEESGKNVIANFEDNTFDGKWIECQAARPKDDEKGRGRGGDAGWDEWGKGCGKMEMMAMFMAMKGKMSKMKGGAGKGSEWSGGKDAGPPIGAPGKSDGWGGGKDDGWGKGKGFDEGKGFDKGFDGGKGFDKGFDGGKGWDKGWGGGGKGFDEWGGGGKGFDEWGGKGFDFGGGGKGFNDWGGGKGKMEGGFCDGWGGGKGKGKMEGPPMQWNSYGKGGPAWQGAGDGMKRGPDGEAFLQFKRPKFD
mmetsp:Transcript_17634/g.40825  ORF Transcript_17634/g.40825 Transcript_17634/m.40825 type:complete len:611 (+) Transcript_17634:148-1980(+)